MHFLDLYITFDGSVSYCTYRKPGCSYSYVPFNSCHPFATKNGIVRTEVARLHRTCKQKEDFLREVLFFKAKAKACGYPSACFDRVLNGNGTFRSVQCPRPANNDVVPFKLRYFHGAECLRISKHYHDCAVSLNKDFDIVVCYMANKNLFRQRFGRFV